MLNYEKSNLVFCLFLGPIVFMISITKILDVQLIKIKIIVHNNV